MRELRDIYFVYMVVVWGVSLSHSGENTRMGYFEVFTVQPKRNAQTKFSCNQFANLVAFSLHVHLARISSQIG